VDEAEPNLVVGAGGEAGAGVVEELPVGVEEFERAEA
jgi:hypothetical protein